MEDYVYKLDGIAQILRGFAESSDCQQGAAMDILAEQVEKIANEIHENYVPVY